MVTGISHITFVVKDLDISTRFLTDIFGAKQMYDSGGKQFSLSAERFFLIGGVWVCLMQGEALQTKTYNHTAFAIPEAEFDECVAKIKAMGVEMRPPRPRVEGEGRSVYFYDYDNHLFELHTGTLAERLARYRQ